MTIRTPTVSLLSARSTINARSPLIAFTAPPHVPCVTHKSRRPTFARAAHRRNSRSCILNSARRPRAARWSSSRTASCIICTCRRVLQLAAADGRRPQRDRARRMQGNKKYEEGSSDMLKILGSLPPRAWEDEAVKHALELRSVMAMGDYHGFFQLYRRAPNMVGPPSAEQAARLLRARGASARRANASWTTSSRRHAFWRSASSSRHTNLPWAPSLSHRSSRSTPRTRYAPAVAPCPSPNVTDGGARAVRELYGQVWRRAR